MAKFIYNSAKNTNISHMLFKFYCDYYLKILFKENVNICSKSCFADKLTEKLRELIEVYYQNLFYIQEL